MKSMNDQSRDVLFFENQASLVLSSFSTLVNSLTLTGDEDEIEILDIADVLDEERKNPCKIGFDEYRRNFMSQLTPEIAKKVTREGLGDVLDLENTKVIYKFALFLEHEEFPFSYKDRYCCNMKEGFECGLLGITEALKTMRDQEISTFIIAPSLMYDSKGFFKFSSAEILVELHVTAVENADSDEIDDRTPLQKLRQIIKTDEKLAKSYYRRKSYIEAVRIYQRLIRKLDITSSQSEEEESLIKKLFISYHMKSAMCYYKLKKFSKVCLSIRDLESFTSIQDNPKALYIQGIAELSFNNFEFALQSFLAAKNILPDDPQIQAALEQCTKKENDKKENDIKERELQKKCEEEFKLLRLNIEKKEEDFKKALEKEKEELREQIMERIRDFKIYQRENENFKCYLNVELKDSRQITFADTLLKEQNLELIMPQMGSDFKFIITKSSP